MKIHCCLFDKHCREYNVPLRLYISSIFGWDITIALNANSKSMKWNSKTGYYKDGGGFEDFGWITYSPNLKHRCEYEISLNYMSRCPRRKNHRGPHYNWRTKEFMNQN